LLPPIFARLHPKFRTPAFSTIITGLVVAIPSLFMNLTEVTDLTSIGTLFAFILVSGGILIMNPYGKKNQEGKGFKVPYADSRKYLIPIWIVILFFVWKSDITDSDFITAISTQTGLFGIVRNHFPLLIFGIVSVVISVLAVIKHWSLIPVLGLLTNLYLMSELGVTNWFRFGIWLLIGLILYFSYGAKHSRIKVV
jgi:amino acid transporter